MALISCSLAPITEPGLVLPAIAQRVGTREAPGQPLSESLAITFATGRHCWCLTTLSR